MGEMVYVRSSTTQALGVLYANSTKPGLFNTLFVGLVVYLSPPVHKHRQILLQKDFICYLLQ